ncbi:hypothetical protein AABB24_014303 [Solanum stoloniferum]|uniref:Uncharacterized protein n=1 Tax=Solanum stoloniferum TaxID=62892 RepID=A0ABD2TXZ2_9SOLN
MSLDFSPLLKNIPFMQYVWRHFAEQARVNAMLQYLCDEICFNEESANLSTLFDVKGVVGGILTGYISDQFDDRAITTASFMYCVITAPCLFRSYRHISVTINIILIIA